MKTDISCLTVEKLNDVIVDAIQDVKGKGIVKMDLRKLESSPTDFFIICEGDSSTQVKAISNRIHKRVKEEFFINPNHVEGKANGEWVLVDYFNVVVHIFHPESRKFYELENLWSDAEITEYENV